VIVPLAIVQSAHGGLTFNGTNQVFPALAANPTPGNLLVCMACVNTAAGSCPPASGYGIDVYQTGAGSYGSFLAHKTAGAGEPKAQQPCALDLGAGLIAGAVWELSGGSGLIDVIAHHENYTGTISQPITTTGPNGITLFYGSDFAVQSGSSWAVGGGLVSDGQDNVISRLQAAGHLVTATATTYTPTVTPDTAGVNQSQSICVNIR